MASNFLHQAQRGASRGSIDLPLAVLAALSIGFVALMLPAEILSRIVETSRIPEFLPTAAPPLGAKARIALSIAGAGATFAAVWLLLRMLGGRKPAQPKARDWADIDREPETPRLRRSDVHPDAPARRPILAARELGEPAPAPAPEAPLAPPADPETAAHESSEDELELAGPDIEMIVDPFVEAPASEAPTVEEPVAAAPALPQPTVAEPAAAPPEPQPAGEESIADLMARLERGLARRQQEKIAAPAPAAAAEPPAPGPAAPEPAAPAEHWGDERLRSAIENLQRMAARAG